MHPRRAAVVASWLLAAACAAATAPPPASLQPVTHYGHSIDAELAADARLESFPWSAGRPLQLADFKAPVPAGAAEGARTAYVLSYGFWCRGDVFRFEGVASFVVGHSWVKPRALTDAVEGRRILNHEQTHFNQTEVYARRMRRFFAELYNPCGHTEAELDALADRFVNDEAAAQQRYDQDTSFGLNPARQQAWDRDIRSTLAELDAFSTYDASVLPK
jgi:hypothetical protein